MTSVEYDLEATMRDGVVLRADVYRPSSAGPWPVLLVRTPYDKQDPVILGLLDPLAATRRGFMVVIQDVRGRFSSDGDWEPVVGEGADGRDTVRWAARLAGSTGRVAMYGPSYLGQVQLAALITRAPELVAAAVAFTWADPHDGFVARGGAAELGLVTGWSLRSGFDVLRRRGAGRDDVLQLFAAVDRFNALPRGSEASVPRAFDLPLPGRPDGPPLPVAARALPDVVAPAFIIAGWYDPFLQGSLDTYALLQGAGKAPTLLVGPWSHNNQSGYVGDVAFGAAADARTLDLGASLYDRQLDWLGSHLDPEQDETPKPQALVYVMGANRWRRLDNWPPASVEVPWYLQEHGQLGTERSTTPGGADTFHFDPGDPVPTCGGPILISPTFAPGPVDQSSVEDRPDVLLYTSAPLTAAVTVIGRVHARLFLAADVPSTDTVVRLCDVDTDGVSRNVVDGVLRVDTADTETREVVVDLWSTAYVFEVGHRLRLQITWSCYPRWDRAQAEASATVQHRVHRSPDRPSRIMLPLQPQSE